MNDYMKVIGGTLLGIAGGIAIGYLSAPDKGSRTRKKLKKDARKLSDEMEEAALQRLNEAKDILNDKVESWTEKTHDGIDSIKKKVKVA